MANIKELKMRIESIAETRKITNAMYLISTTKLRRAKSELEKTRPYFSALRSEIKRIFRINSNIESKYFFPPDNDETAGTRAYLVITSDKGLVGAYNQNVIKEVNRELEAHPNSKFFVVGDYGRHYFSSHHIQFDEEFNYSAEDPTLALAREIAFRLLDALNSGEVSEIYIIFNDFERGASVVQNTRILPFHRADFASHEDEKEVNKPFEFMPSIEVVLESMMPSYVTGFVYSTLVDSYCCEQNSRRVAMESANNNSDEMLEEIRHQYNYTRQKMITQEIIEIVSGAKYQQSNKNKEGTKNG